MRRRELLRAVLLVLAGASTSVADELRRASGRPLSDAETETLLAFAEVLVGAPRLSPPERGELLSHIADRVGASEEALALYREAAALLDRLTTASFSALGLRERLDLVARHRLVPSRGTVERSEDPAQRARTRVAPDLIAAYYGSPRGWAVAGYGVFPGRCGDLVRYTRPEP